MSADLPGKIRLGCAGIVRRGIDTLLGKRNKDPNRGKWILPGGGARFGETIEQALKRETREEAGIEVDVLDLATVFEIINPPDEHRVIVYMNATFSSGEPTASSDLSEVRFFSPDELRALNEAGEISSPVQTVLLRVGLLPE